MTDPVVVRPAVFHSPERKTRLLLASLPIFAGLLSNNGTVLECNFGPLGAPLEERSDWIGESFEMGPWWNYSEDSRSDILIMLGQAQHGKRVSKERLYKRSDGRMGVLMLSLVPLFAPYGQPDAILVIAVDITERRRESETAEQVAYDMAHRLRNSFTIMRTLATRSDLEDPGSRQQLSKRLSRVRESHELTYRYLFFEVPIQDILEAAIADMDQVGHMEIGPLSIPSHDVEMLMLALGELSAGGHKAAVEARRIGEGRIRMTWTEAQPRSDQDMPKGLSEMLLGPALEAQTGGTVELSNNKTGFVWSIDFPISLDDADAQAVAV